jgi:hypothetical protein
VCGLRLAPKAPWTFLREWKRAKKPHEIRSMRVVLSARKIANGRPGVAAGCGLEVVRAVVRASECQTREQREVGGGTIYTRGRAAWGEGPCAATGAKFAVFVA